MLEVSDVVEVRIAALSMDARTNSPVLILRPLEEPAGEGRILPIWIGHPEASAIMMALEDAEPPRPFTHDLFHDVLEHLGAYVERVEIVRVEDGTFYAALVIRAEERRLVVDARPSDSIALAVRFGAPLFVAEDVLAEAAVAYEDFEEPVDEDAQIEEFRAFLESVDPSEFGAS